MNEIRTCMFQHVPLVFLTRTEGSTAVCLINWDYIRYIWQDKDS